MAFDPSTVRLFEPDAVKSTFDPSTAKLYEEKSSTIGSEFLKGIQSGADSLQGTGYGLAGIAGDKLGIDTLKNWGLEGYRRNNEEAQANAPEVGRFEDIHGIGDAAKYAAQGIGQLVPFAGASLVTGGAGGAIARLAGGSLVKGAAEKAIASGATDAVAKQVAAKSAQKLIERGAMTGLAANSIGTEAGSIYGDIYDKTGQTEANTALGYGAVAGALDLIPEIGLLGKLTGKTATKGLLREVGGQAAKEAVTEGAQTVVERDAVASVDPTQDVFSPEGVSDIANSVIIGGLGGVVAGAGGKVFGQGEAKPEPAPEVNTTDPTQPIVTPDGTTIDPNAGPISKAGALAVATIPQAPLIDDGTTPVSGPFVDRPAQPMGQQQEQLDAPLARLQLTAPQQQETPLLPGPQRTGEVIVDSQGVARPGTTADIQSRRNQGSTIAVDAQGNAVRQTRQQEQAAAEQRQAAIDSGLTPDVRAAQAKYLLPFKTEAAATKIAASLSKSRSDQYEVIPHPTQSGKFAVVPHETTASPAGSVGVGRTDAVGSAGVEPVLRSTGNPVDSNAEAPVAAGRKAVSTRDAGASNTALTKPVDVWAGRYGKGMTEPAARQQLAEKRRENPNLEWSIAESDKHDYPYVIEGRSVSPKTKSETQTVLPVASETQSENPFSESTSSDRLRHPEIRAELEQMAQNAGWAQVGGKIVRAPSEDGMGEVTGRTPWIPKEAWWQSRPDALNEDKTREAVRKALAGEKLNAKERRTVDYMTAVAQQSITSRLFAPTEEELQGLENTDALAVSMVARAAELDENAVEDLARAHVDDGAAFMHGIQQILDDHDQDTKTDGGGKESPPAKERPEAEITNAPPSEGQVVSGADEFVAAPDGGIDFGEINKDVAQQIRREPAKIRLTISGKRHIKERHGAELRGLGYSSIEEFVSEVAQQFNVVAQPNQTRQLVVGKINGRDKILFVQLEPNKDGTAYLVNSGYDSTREVFINRVESGKWKLLLDGRAPASNNSGDISPLAEPLNETGQAATNASGQSSDASISPASENGNSEFALTAETPDQVRAKAEEQERADKAEQKKQADADQQARQAREAKDIADRQYASAENFELGQSAQDGLSGQGNLLREPAVRLVSQPSPSFLKKFMVETDAYDPDADRYVKQQVSAKEAMASINEDITTIKALLKCLRG